MGRSPSAHSSNLCITAPSIGLSPLPASASPLLCLNFLESLSNKPRAPKCLSQGKPRLTRGQEPYCHSSLDSCQLRVPWEEVSGSPGTSVSLPKGKVLSRTQRHLPKKRCKCRPPTAKAEDTPCCPSAAWHREPQDLHSIHQTWELP